MKTVRMMAGIPALNAGLYRKIRFLVGDPVAWIELEQGTSVESTLILRDIEMDRARRAANATRVASPMEFMPAGGRNRHRSKCG